MFNWLRNLLLKNAISSSKIATANENINNIDELVRRGFELHESGKDAEAAVVFKKILLIDPFHADSLYILGSIVNKFGDKQRAIELIEKAILSKDSESFFYMALGDIYLTDWDLTNAAKYYELAIELEPDSIPTLLALGSAYEHLRYTEKAQQCFNKVLTLQPDCPPAFNKLGEVFLDCGKTELAIENFRLAHINAPHDYTLCSSYLFSLNYSTTLSASEVFSEHKKFDDLYGKGLYGHVKRTIKHPNPYRKLRIGYISPDFRLHAVSSFFEPVLTHRDKNNFEVFCYHLHQVKDSVSLRLKSKTDHWIECSSLPDIELFRKIENDEIDILVDLTGHTSHSRLLVLAQKPATIQITWLGYINTTGLTSMDYRIVDYYSDPIGFSEHNHSEKLLRLPNSQWCYSKIDESIAISPLPSRKSNQTTFGSFNRFNKLSERILKLWIRVMKSIENSQLLIIDVPEDEQKRVRNFFRDLGIDADRLTLYDRLQYNDFVDLHNIVDIAFDAHPYSGATTTCDSLWMGVPTLTLTGGTSISRSTSSILHTLGLDDWVANTEDEFVEIAIKKSNAGQKLSELRAGLRQRMQSSPLMDAALFSKNLENLYREVWIEKCKEQQTNK